MIFHPFLPLLEKKELEYIQLLPKFQILENVSSRFVFIFRSIINGVHHASHQPFYIQHLCPKILLTARRGFQISAMGPIMARKFREFASKLRRNASCFFFSSSAILFFFFFFIFFFFFFFFFHRGHVVERCVKSGHVMGLSLTGRRWRNSRRTQRRFQRRCFIPAVSSFCGFNLWSDFNA